MNDYLTSTLNVLEPLQDLDVGSITRPSLPQSSASCSGGTEGERYPAGDLEDLFNDSDDENSAFTSREDEQLVSTSFLLFDHNPETVKPSLQGQTFLI